MRRFVIILAVCAAVMAVAVLTLPWWLGAAAGWVGPRFGLTLGDYERIGYARFAVRDVEVRRPGVTVTISRVESFTPLVWLWRKATGGDVTAIAGEWRTEVQRREQETTVKRPRGWVPLRAQLTKVADRLEQWVPSAEVGRGVVTWPRGELTIESAVWRGRTLVSPRVMYRGWGAAVTLKLPEDGTISAELESPENEASARLRSEGERVDGDVIWWGEPVDVKVRFAEEGWRPLEAGFVAENWEVPGERVRLGEQYASIRGDVRIEWRDENLTANVSASGVPREGAKAPPLEVAIRGHGEGGRFVAETIEVELPGVTASLSEPVEIDRTGRVHSAASHFRFEADLERQRWLEAAGRLAGVGTISANEDGRPLIAFAFSGDGLDVLETRLSRIDARGTLNWPVLRIDAAQLTGTREDQLEATGAWDFRERAVHGAKVTGSVHREAFGRWLPEGVGIEVVAVDATAEGPLSELKHEGRAEIGELRVKEFSPAKVVASWRGASGRVEEFAAEARMKEATLVARGAGDRLGMDLRELEWTKAGERILALAEPARVEWAERRAGPLRLRGPEAHAEVELAWGETGRVELTLEELRSEWLRDFVEMPAVEWRVDGLKFAGQWDRGPLVYRIDTRATVILDEQRSAYFSAQFTGDANGLNLGHLRVSEGEGVVVNASGALPIVVQPLQRPLVVFDQNARFTLDAATSPNPVFWEKFDAADGIGVGGAGGGGEVRRDVGGAAGRGAVAGGAVGGGVGEIQGRVAEDRGFERACDGRSRRGEAGAFFVGRERAGGARGRLAAGDGVAVARVFRGSAAGGAAGGFARAGAERGSGGGGAAFSGGARAERSRASRRDVETGCDGEWVFADQ